MKNKNNRKASLWKSIKVGVASLLVMVIFAFGFQITKVNLEQLSSKTRQASLIRVARALAKPDFFAFEQEEEIVNTPLYVPCPASGYLPAAPEPTSSTSLYLVLTPACANPGETIQVEGFNFTDNIAGPLRFVPGNDPNNIVTLGRENVKADSKGHFIASMVLPDRPSTDVQYIRASLHRNIGAPHLTQSARDTWDKIVETVFLALLATVFGTILAIPISFLAARNLMKPVKSPLISISMSVLGWVVGIGLGLLIVRGVGKVSNSTGSNIWINLSSVVGSPMLIWLGFRWAIPQEEINPPRTLIRLARLVVLFLGVLIGFYGLFQLASLTKTVGTILTAALGSFGFLGNFLFQVSSIVVVLTPALGGLAAGGALGGFLGRIGQQVSEKISAKDLKTINLFLTSIAGATILTLLGQLIEWLYQIGNPLYTLWAPMAGGALLGLLLAIFSKAKEALPIGMAIYFITRTILNALRSVEALVMAIVFVIAVGIGPFAGVLALGLHTIVSLAKLYSEQVESIMSGPLEAVQATGANRLQTIVYAVIPQIIPPYISYTMYRWDINVRMSTIIGFVGGGGIGFLLQQNINLLNYRGASAQMVAIAVVVASMDYISSVLREKTI
jgi:phosphonate ABC transporter permease subunit PhnE